MILTIVKGVQMKKTREDKRLGRKRRWGSLTKDSQAVGHHVYCQVKRFEIKPDIRISTLTTYY